MIKPQVFYIGIFIIFVFFNCQNDNTKNDFLFSVYLFLKSLGFGKNCKKRFTKKRILNPRRTHNPLCKKGTFTIQFTGDENNFEECKLVKGRILCDRLWPKTMPKRIDSPQKGSLIFSKPGNGGSYTDSSLLFIGKDKKDPWFWYRIPNLLWLRIRKELKRARNNLFDPKYSFIHDKIKDQKPETILDIESLLESPAVSFTNIYKLLSEKNRAVIVLLRIIIDYLKEP